MSIKDKAFRIKSRKSKWNYLQHLIQPTVTVKMILRHMTQSKAAVEEILRYLLITQTAQVKTTITTPAPIRQTPHHQPPTPAHI